MATYELKISTLNPVHIGNGEELRADFDFITENGQTYRLDEDKVLEDFYDEIKPDRYGNYPTLGEILRNKGLTSASKYHRYTLSGQPQSRRSDARMKACIKDVHDVPYLPGSSIKGALRTALAWTGWEESSVQFDIYDLGRRRQWAGQKLERQVFGKNPNYDLLRAMQVSDCFCSQARDHLIVANAKVLTKKNAGSPVEIESIAGDVPFTGTLKIDDFLFTPQADRVLHMSGRRQWLDTLCLRLHALAGARLKKMADWFDAIDHGTRVEKFLSRLLDLNQKLRENQAFLQLGWGTGWDGKTFWTHLQKDEYQFEEILEKYRMVRQGKRERGDEFPRSRRALMRGKGDNAIPIAPFGWCLLELKES